MDTKAGDTTVDSNVNMETDSSTPNETSTQEVTVPDAEGSQNSPEEDDVENTGETSKDDLAVRRSTRKRIAKVYDSPSPPPPVKRPRPPTSGSKASSTKIVAKRPVDVPDTSKDAPTTSKDAPTTVGKSAAKGVRILKVGTAAPVAAKKTGPLNMPSTSRSQPPLLHPKLGKPTAISLKKPSTATARIEDDPLASQNIREEIARLRVANDVLANSNNNFSRQIMRMGDKLQRLKTKLDAGAKRDSVENVIAKAKDLLTDVPAMLFASQLRNCGREPGFRRFTEADLLLANAIYTQSPKCYLFLSKVFSLPGVDGLHNWVATKESAAGKGLDKAYYESRGYGNLIDPVPVVAAPRNRGKKNPTAPAEAPASVQDPSPVPAPTSSPAPASTSPAPTSSPAPTTVSSPTRATVSKNKPVKETLRELAEEHEDEEAPVVEGPSMPILVTDSPLLG